MSDYYNFKPVKLYYKLMDDCLDKHINNNNNYNYMDGVRYIHNYNNMDRTGYIKYYNDNIINEAIYQLQKENYYEFETEWKNGFYSVNDKSYMENNFFFWDIPDSKLDIFSDFNKLTNENCINSNNYINIWCVAYFLYMLEETENKSSLINSEGYLRLLKILFNSNLKNKILNDRINEINSQIFNLNNIKSIIEIIERNINSKSPKFIHIVCCSSEFNSEDIYIKKKHNRISYTTDINNVENTVNENNISPIPRNDSIARTASIPRTSNGVINNGILVRNNLSRTNKSKKKNLILDIVLVLLTILVLI
jgi:hypothetical protein